MIALILNSLQEKLRSKGLYIVGLIGVFIITFLMLNADFTFDNRKITSFKELVPFAVIMVNFLASMLAVMLSLQTIPSEFERKTTHLVLARGIKPYQYMLSLTLSNIILSIISLFILSISIVIFCISKGQVEEVPRIISAVIVMGTNIAILSGLTSLLSIKIPMFINGIIGITFYFLGVFHDLLLTFGKEAGGVLEVSIKYLLILIPDFHMIQKEAGLFIAGSSIDFYPILLQLVFLSIILTLICFTFRKEV